MLLVGGGDQHLDRGPQDDVRQAESRRAPEERDDLDVGRAGGLHHPLPQRNHELSWNLQRHQSQDVEVDE